MININLGLKHFNTLLVLNNTGSIAEAAQVLGLTQSALSYQLKFLEVEFQTSLFQRKSNPIKFTRAGKRLLHLAQSLIDQTEQAKQDILYLSGPENPTLRLAIECYTCYQWLMPVLDRFRNQWSAVELDIVSGFQADAIQLLLDHEADIAIVSELDQVDSNIELYPLFSFEMVAVLPTSHPLINQPYLKESDFDGEVYITYPVSSDRLLFLKKCLTPANIQPNLRTTELTSTLLQLVSSGRGISVLPYWAIDSYVERNYIASKSIGKDGLSMSLYAAIRKNDKDLVFYQDFIQGMSYQNMSHLTGIRDPYFTSNNTSHPFKFLSN